MKNGTVKTTDQQANDIIYLVDIGYNEPTKIYELVPKQVVSINGLTLSGVIDTIYHLNGKNIVIETGNPDIYNYLAQKFNVLKGLGGLIDFLQKNKNDRK